VSKRSRKKQSRSQQVLWLLSLVMVGSMVVSLGIVALPSSRHTPTPPPTWTLPPSPTPLPTFTPLPSPTLGATEPPPPSPTVEATAPPAGPELPTGTKPPAGPELPTITPGPTSEATAPAAGPELPTVTPTLTTTSSTLSPRFAFAVCGDSRDGAATYRRVLDGVAGDGSLFLIHTGDLVNNGTEALWQEFEAMMAGFALPFYPVPGNHDGRQGKLDGYLAHSGAPAAHYSFDYGPVHLTLADSHAGGIGAGELAWLREDLSSTSQPIKMVFLHHPPFDPDGTDHIMAYGNEPFMALMAEQDVDYVFAGHIHAYAQAERNGVLYTITGGAGAPLYAGDHPQAYHHYLRITVQGESVEIAIVRI